MAKSGRLELREIFTDNIGLYSTTAVFGQQRNRNRRKNADRQTDGRTDRISIAIPRLHSMQRGKNKDRRYTSDANTAYTEYKTQNRKTLITRVCVLG